MQATPEEIRFLEGQRLLEPTTSKATWVLLSVVNRALASYQCFPPATQAALRDLEEAGVSGLGRIENAQCVVEGSLVSDQHSHHPHPITVWH